MIDVLMDLDPTVYACGFAAQKTTYQLTLESEQGELSHATFSVQQDKSAGEQMKEFVNSLPKDMYVIDKQKLVTPDPLDHCLRIVRHSLDTIRQAVADRFGSITWHAVLSGSANYRFNIAKRVPYKGNRLPESRPHHYASIRKYLEQNWNPLVTAGNEADDEISILAEQAKTQHRDVCIVSIDKDLDQIEGWHYNPAKKVFYQQDRDSALSYFYQQALSGDSTDNIPGCFRIGADKAEKLIAEWTHEFEGIGLNEELFLWEQIVKQYAISANRRGCPYTEEEAESVAIETARLVYIQRAPHELWNPPGVTFGRTDELLRPT